MTEIKTVIVNGKRIEADSEGRQEKKSVAGLVANIETADVKVIEETIIKSIYVHLGLQRPRQFVGKDARYSCLHPGGAHEQEQHARRKYRAKK